MRTILQKLVTFSQFFDKNEISVIFVFHLHSIGFPDGFEPEPMIRINGVVLPLSEHLKERHESDSIIQDDTLSRPR